MGKKSKVKEKVVVTRDLNTLDRTVLPPLRLKTPKALPPLPPTPGGRRKFANESQLRCGVIQIIGGVGAIMLGVGAIIAGCGGEKPSVAGTNVYGSGIWGGVIMIVAGIIGVVSSKNEKTSAITGCLVFSVFSLICSILFMAFSVEMYVTDSNADNNKKGGVRVIAQDISEQRINIDIVSIVVGIMVLIVAIIQIAICGRALNHTAKRKRDNRVFFLARPMPDDDYQTVRRQGAIMVVPAGLHEHPRPQRPPIRRHDETPPDTPPPRYGV